MNPNEPQFEKYWRSKIVDEINYLVKNSRDISIEEICFYIKKDN